MIVKNTHSNEGNALNSLRLFNAAEQLIYDAMIQLAADICGTTIAAISILDENRLYYKAQTGIKPTEDNGSFAICNHAIAASDEVFLINDTKSDDRFSDAAIVTSPPFVRSYAGAKFKGPEGKALGVVCVMDSAPRQFTQTEQDNIKRLAQVLEYLMQSRKTHVEAQAFQQELIELRSRCEILAAMSSCDADARLYMNELGMIQLTNGGFERFALAGRSFDYKHIGDISLPIEPKGILVGSMFRAVGGEEVFYDAILKVVNSEARPVSIRCRPLPTASSRTTGAVLIMAESTATKASSGPQKALELMGEVNESQRWLIRILSHDLRDPLNSIINFAFLMRSKHADEFSFEARNYLKYIESGGGRMRELLDGLLEYVRLGHDPDTSEMVNLIDMASDIRDDLSCGISTVDAQLEIANLPVVHGSKTLLRLALQNLIANAVKFRHADRRCLIKVYSKAQKNGVAICVEDNGIGVPESAQSRIFDIYYRGHLNKDYEGTGLGLALCKRVAELHKGHITFEPIEHGGARFCLFLPQTTSAQ